MRATLFMAAVESSVLWDAVGGVAAAGALLVSVLVWRSQRGRDRQQADMQQRLTSIEEGRRQDEIESRDEARDSALVADVRVSEFRIERPGGAGDSDLVSITIENRGPALARSIDIALLDSEDRAPGNHLGDAVELLDTFGGFDGKAREGYFQIPMPRPMEPLSANGTVTLPFWLRYREIGNSRIRVAWEDGRGSQIARPSVHLNTEPAWRY